MAYPINAYLYRIKKVKSPNCTFCESGDRETISHFLKVCPKFHHARTAAHNRCDKLCSSCSRNTPKQTGNLSKKLLCI